MGPDQPSAIPARRGTAQTPSRRSLAGDVGWGDVVLRARLQSDGAGAIGVVFR
jgi:hypothetical protein